MTFERIEFPPPAKPWSTNQDRNLHHLRRAELIKQWKGAARLLAGYLTRDRPGIVQVWIPFGDKRRRDPHNYCGTVVKAIIDGLVMAGVWPDDTPEWVGHREPVLYKGNKVIVEITAMERNTNEPSERVDTPNPTDTVGDQAEQSTR